MSDGPTGERACHRCGAPVPRTRTVCPACGTLQRPRPRPTGSTSAQPEPAAPADVPASGGEAPWHPARPSRSARARAEAVDLPAEPPAETIGGRRRRPVLVAAVVASIALAAVGAWALAVDGEDATARPTPTLAPGSGRAAAVRRSCAAPHPWTGPGTIARFTPGAGAVAYAALPPSPTSTDPPQEVVLQVSPEVGQPTLTLEGSIDLVSLAVCVRQTRTTGTDATCTYEVTTPGGRLGDRVRKGLRVTTYRAEIVDLRTGKVLASSTTDSARDRCPQFATLDRSWVADPLSADDLIAWLNLQMPGGIPTG